MADDDHASRRKRITIISFSSIFLAAMAAAVTLGLGLNHNESIDPKSGSKYREISAQIKAIKSICEPTDYKAECVKSLRSEAGDTTEPKELIKAAFKVSMKEIAKAANKSTVLQELEKEPRGKMALDSCKELMDLAIGELESSYKRFEEFDIEKVDEMLIDLRVWLSAAITYQETCLEGFQNTTGDAGKKMKKALKTAMHLSSNGLAMVSEISDVLTDSQIPGLGRRRLLHEVNLPVLGHGELPEWLNPGVRRLLYAPAATIKVDIVVAQDGSGKFETINEALLHIPKKSNKTFVLYIKEGVYKEYVQLNKSMTHVMMIGDGAQKTRITGNKNFVDGIPTFKTSTVAISGDYFIAKNIGFENSAGPEKHQAVALRIQSDMSIFYNCSMDGYQDTLYVHTKRQFFRDCTISGTIDFVFGDSAAVFQNCKFVVRKPMDNQACVVTAQGRKEKRQPSGLVLQGCTITSDPAFYPWRFKRSAYLGRPWKEYSRTIIMESYIDDLIHPEGWLPMLGNFGLKTCFYAEFRNQGPGASTRHRVTWRGIKNITREHALNFVPKRFIMGDSWIKPTRVPYTSSFVAAETQRIRVP